MKILRSVTRRGYNVQTAGYFTVVSPRRWFAASQFPDGLEGHIKVTAETDAARDRADIEETEPPQIAMLSTRDRQSKQFVWAALAAAVIALLLLWWFFHVALRLPLKLNIF
jgi:hypothetical protein